jgi:hypothetical protein
MYPANFRTVSRIWFTADDGRVYEFDYDHEAGRRITAASGTVAVHYDPADPVKSATADTPNQVFGELVFGGVIVAASMLAFLGGIAELVRRG